MKTFPTAFATELAKKTGITPVWVLRLTVNSVLYQISDIAYTFPVGSLSSFAGTTLPWVSSWGQLRENISGNLGEILIADLSLSLLVDQANADNIRHLALSHDLETAPAELYLWLDGLDATAVAPQLVFRGYVKDISLPDMTQVDITIEDETARLRQPIGTKLDSTTYPLSDPDDIGKMIPIPFGTVEKVPALCVDSGWVSSLVSAITAGERVFAVAELPGYSLAGKTITIQDEDMTVTSSDSSQSAANRAAAVAGATITATSTLAGTYAQSVINSNHLTPGGVADFWKSNAAASGGAPQTLEVTFPVPMLVNTFNIFFPQDTLSSTTEPTLNVTTGTTYVVPDWSIWIYTGYWQQIGVSYGNDKIWRQWTSISQVATAARIVFTTNCPGGYAACAEFEVWGTISGAPGSSWLTVTRGANSTLPIEHEKASVILEKKSTPLIYLCSDRPLTSISTIYARIKGLLVDITADCTKYLNVAAGDLGGLYVGKAAITIPDILNVSKKISIALENSLALEQGSHTHTTGTGTTNITFDQAYAYSGLGWNDPTHFMDQAIDGSTTTYAKPDSRGGVVWVNRVAAATGSGTPIQARVVFDMVATYAATATSYNIYVAGVIVATGSFPAMARGLHYSPSFTLSAWTQLLASNGFRMEVRIFLGGLGQIYDTYVQVTTGTAISYSPAVGAGLTGALNLSGNSVSDVYIGDAVLVSMTRTMASIAAVFNDLLTTYCADSTAITQVGTFPASFAFNGVINEYRPALEWFDILAFQCASYFRKSGGVVRLIYRDPTTAAAGTISACKLSEEGMKILSHRKAPVSDVVNTIKVLYRRQWDSTGKQADSYSAISATSSSTSIAIHGVREEPDLFMFDFVTGASMASDLMYIYLLELSVRKWHITFAAFLDSLKYEFADFVTLSIDSGQKARIIESGIVPGDTGRIDTIEFTVVA